MGELSFYYLLHEIGHGISWTNVSSGYPILKGYEWCTGNLNDIQVFDTKDQTWTNLEVKGSPPSATGFEIS